MKKALLILHQKISKPGDIGNKLLNRGFKLDIRKPSLGDKLPSTMSDHELAVIFGGPMSINNSNLDFIKYEIEWINNIVLSSSKPFLGICLGAQMLAKCLGGQVDTCHDKSSEVGFFNILPTNEGESLFKNQKVFFQWHNEGITNLKSCKILAEGEKFHIQAFQHKNTFGIQFHPEVNLYLHLRWLFFVLIYSRYKLKANGVQSISEQIKYRFKYNKKISNWLNSFLDNYLLKI